MTQLRPSPNLTALRIAMLFSMTKKTRGRITQKTFAIISGRERHTPSFQIAVRDALEDFSIIIFPLARGGFGLVKISALEGAPLLTIKNDLKQHDFSGKAWKYLTEDEIFSALNSSDADIATDEE